MSNFLVVSEQHPSLAGHFPGYPVVPGVVILDKILAELQQTQPKYRAVGIKKTKFLQQLKPGREFFVEFAPLKNNGVRFKCLFADDQQLMAEGHIQISVD